MVSNNFTPTPRRPDNLHRSDKLEERVIRRRGLAFLQPSVSPDELAHEDLDLLQREVEADAHPLAGGEAARAC